MPGPGDIKAGRAFVEVGISDKIAAGLKGVERRLRAFGSAVAGIGLRLAAFGGVIVTGFLKAADIFQRTGSELHDMSVRTGVSTDALQELGYAATLTGSSLEEVEKGLGHMSKLLLEAKEGGAGAAQTLRDLHLSAGELIGLKPDKQFEAIAQRLADTKNATERAALAMAVFGKSGRQLLPMIEEMAELRNQWRRMGIALSSTDIRAADKLGDTLDAAKFSVKAIANVIGASLAPMLTELLQRAASVAQWIAQLINQNRALVVVAFQVAAAVAAAGIALIALGGAVWGVALAVRTLGLAWAGISAVIGIAKAATLAVLSPMGLVIIAATGIAAALIYLSGVGDQALSFLAAKFGDLSSTAKETWGGIADAIASGDLALAGKIAIAGLKLAWLEGTKEIRELWIELTGGLQAAWVQTTSAIASIWTDLWAGIKSVSESVTNWLAKQFVWIMGQFDSSIDVATAQGQLDQQSADNQSDIEAKRKARQDVIERQQGEDLAAIGDSISKREQAAQDALAAARDELKTLRQNAADAKQDAIDRKREAPEFAFDQIAETVSKISSAGVFNVSAAFGLAGGPFANLEKTADKQLKVLEDIRDQGGMTFA